MTPASSWAGDTYAVNFTVEGHAGKFSSRIIFTTKERPDMKVVAATMVPSIANDFGVTPDKIQLKPMIFLAREMLQ